jgi:hypothetical protein
MFAWTMTCHADFFASVTGLPLAGLGSFAVQKPIKIAFAVNAVVNNRE